MKKRSLIILSMGAGVLLATTVWFMFLYEASDVMGFTGYLYLLLAELIFFGGLGLVDIFISTRKKLFLSTPFFILLGYFVLSVAVSLFFMMKPVEKKALFMVVQVLFLAITAMLLFLMLAAERSTPSTRFSEIEWNNPLREATNKIRALKDDPENEAFKSNLISLYERFVFLDSSLKRNQDEDILKGMKELEIVLVSLDYEAEEKRQKVEEKIEDVVKLLKEREYEIRETPWSV